MTIKSRIAKMERALSTTGAASAPGILEGMAVSERAKRLAAMLDVARRRRAEGRPGDDGAAPLSEPQVARLRSILAQPM